MRRLSSHQGQGDERFTERLPPPPQQQQRPPRRRTTMTRNIDADGLLGSLRRCSLDSQTDCHHLENNDGNDFNAVSDYQEVFRQLKLENPTASMGALQQKTMERMAELRALRVEEERRKREEIEKKEEEERLRNQSAAEKYVNRIVGKIRLARPPSLQDLRHQDSNTSLLKYSQQLHNNISPQDQSQSAPHHHHTDNGNESFPFIAVPTGLRVSMISSSTSAAIRASSALIDIPWTNNGVRRWSSADSSSQSNDNKNGDATTNLAPRRSVNDVSLWMTGSGGGGGDADSRSIQSYRSNASGIFSNSDDGNSIVSGKSGVLYIDDIPSSPCSPPLDKNRQNEQPRFNSNENDRPDDGGAEDVITQMLLSCQSSSWGILDRHRAASSNTDNDGKPSTPHQKCATADSAEDVAQDFISSSIIISKNNRKSYVDNSDRGEQLSLDNKSSSSHSTAGRSSRTSISGVDGLIVGFGDRSRRNSHIGATAAAEDDLIVGFVDRHAINSGIHHSSRNR